MKQAKPRKLAARVAVEEIPIITEYIKLDSFLKLSGVCLTGGQAKELVLEGAVRLNGESVTERGKKLRPGDRVAVAGKVFLLTAGSEEA